MTHYHLALYIGVLLSTISQLLLKKGALLDYESWFWNKYVNVFTAAGYALFFIVTILNLYGLQQVMLKEMAYILPLNYILVIGFSGLFFKEKLTARETAGIAMILIGVFVFNL